MKIVNTFGALLLVYLTTDFAQAARIITDLSNIPEITSIHQICNVITYRYLKNRGYDPKRQPCYNRCNSGLAGFLRPLTSASAVCSLACLTIDPYEPPIDAADPDWKTVRLSHKQVDIDFAENCDKELEKFPLVDDNYNNFIKEHVNNTKTCRNIVLNGCNYLCTQGEKDTLLNCLNLF